MTEAVLIYATAPSHEVANQLATHMIERRMAGCINLIDGMRSVYQWQGQLEHAQEVAMIIKTVKSKVPVIKDYFEREHPYENPALLVINVNDALPDYLAWLIGATL